MLKYYNSMVVFEEIPDEITLAINITNCPCKCPSCHSKFLWADTGTSLDKEELLKLIKQNDGITCVCFMGGDINPSEVNELAKIVKEKANLAVGWYSGRDEISDKIELKWFDYVKIGRYDDGFGPLNKETTNQIFYHVSNNGELINKTNLFWKKKY